MARSRPRKSMGCWESAKARGRPPPDKRTGDREGHGGCLLDVELSAAVSLGVVASARKSGTGCGAVACWGLGLVVVLGLPGLAVAGMMVRAARDAEPLWDKSPFISLALGPDPVG